MDGPVTAQGAAKTAAAALFEYAVLQFFGPITALVCAGALATYAYSDSAFVRHGLKFIRLRGRLAVVAAVAICAGTGWGEYAYHHPGAAPPGPPLKVRAVQSEAPEPSRLVAVVTPTSASTPRAYVGLEFTPGEESEPNTLRSVALRVNVSNLSPEVLRSFNVTVRDIRRLAGNEFVQISEVHGGGFIPFSLIPAVVRPADITIHTAPGPNEANEYDLLRIDSRFSLVVTDYEHKRAMAVPGHNVGDWKVELLVEVNGRVEPITLYFDWNEKGLFPSDEPPQAEVFVR